MFAELPRALMNNEGVISSPRAGGSAVTICDMTRYQKNWKISKMTMNKTYYCSENMNTESFFLLHSFIKSFNKKNKINCDFIHLLCTWFAIKHRHILVFRKKCQKTNLMKTCQNYSFNICFKMKPSLTVLKRV